MVSNHIDTHNPHPRPVELLLGLIPVASSAINSQLDAFAQRLADALTAFADQGAESGQARLCHAGAGRLRKHSHAFYHLASAAIKAALQKEMQAVLQQARQARAAGDSAALELVSFEEMDNKVRLGHLARPIVAAHAESLDALNQRFACLLGRNEFPLAQNPLRPEVLLDALNQAWSGFEPDAESHPLLLPLMRPDVFLDMAPILQALNDALVGQGILPTLGDSYRIRKSTNFAAEQKREAQVAEGLKRMLGNGNGNGAESGAIAGAEGVPANLQSQLLQMTAVSNQLMGFLAGMQKTMLERQLSGLGSGDHGSTAVLTDIKRQAPAGALSQVDENTIDLLTSVFDLVFRDQNIATEMKSLIGFLQVPVLKAALIDKDFFFKQEHPARRLVETLAHSSMEWDQASGQDAPVYQTMKRLVERVQQDFDKQMSVFAEVLSDLQGFIQQEERVATATLEAPIGKALKKEKLGQAKKVARDEVAMRVGTGEVVAFVETFLEDKWVSVLTLAYTLQEEKPTAVQSAVSTMDDLIWSVKPKITAAQRKEFLAKLPSILARLNKWLSVVKWEEADRKRFFAELAETHASIVRAPLPLTPEHQLEVALEVAKQAAERRLEKQASVQAAPEPDEFDAQLKKIERGAWLHFSDAHGAAMKAKLSWVSPMRTLFIFTTNRKEGTFQLTDTALTQRLREGTAQAVSLDRLVDRALDQVFANGANDPDIAVKSAA